MQLDAFHSFAVQDHRLVLLVVEALVAIPVDIHTCEAKTTVMYRRPCTDA